MSSITHDYVAANEGLRLKPYRCTAGKLTIGHGRNLEDKGLTPEECRYLLRNDIMEAKMFLVEFFGDVVMRTLNTARETVLIDMYVNMGPKRFKGFERMISAVRRGDWKEAAAQIKDSKYYRQDVPNRAERNRLMMETGEFSA
jgi:lysozyme